MRLKTSLVLAAGLFAAPVLAQDGMKELRAEQAAVPKPTLVALMKLGGRVARFIPGKRK